jgi:hypothetical protein
LRLICYLQGHGKYNGISELETLFPFSFTIPLPAVVNILSGAEHINRCPLGHSYSTPIKILTENSTSTVVLFKLLEYNTRMI